MDSAQSSYLGNTGRPFGVAEPVRPKLGAGRILFHLLLLGATAVTTTLMGMLFSIELPASADAGIADSILGLLNALVADPNALLSGLIYSFTVLAILGAHEMGHYIACRYYGIDATLPYFLPAPPPVLMGTFGAFIKIRSPFPTRKALFDVAVAGPIAGFLFALPASVVGLLYAQPAAATPSEGAITFHDPLLFMLVTRMFHLPESINWNPIQFAAWIGIFATGLNLIPVGQLDGGHAVAALAGHRGHRIISIAFFGLVLALALVSFLRYGSPVWFVMVAFMALLAFRRHPEPLYVEQSIGVGRWLIAAAVLAIFLLSFMPFPITIE